MRHLALLVSGALAVLTANASAQNIISNLVTGNTGNPGSNTDGFFVIGNKAVFVPSGPYGLEPWVTDGTPAGTFMLSDLMPEGSSQPRDLVVLGNEVLFVANVPGLGRENS